MADITELQQALLSPVTGPPLAAALTGAAFSDGVGDTVYNPPLSDDEKDEWAAIYDYQDGTGVLDQTIDYLHDRERHEDRWLDALASSDVPTVLIWGQLDTVSVPAVADFVWCEALEHRAEQAEYWSIPEGHHDVQHDRPDEVAAIVRGFLTGVRPDLDPADAELLEPVQGSTRCDEVGRGR